jgi:hypothetical protein
MPVDLRHAQYLDALPGWERARDVIAGERRIKARGELYLPRLEGQSDVDYAAYRDRACFYNGTQRTHESLLGLVFRSAGVLKLPEDGSSAAAGLRRFVGSVDYVGLDFEAFARKLMGEVLAVGRGGVLVDWVGGESGRPVGLFYAAEDILNWREERINGRQVLTLVVLREWRPSAAGDDVFASAAVEEYRVLRLVDGAGGKQAQAEVWGKVAGAWVVKETAPLHRAGRPLNFLPFLFFGGAGGADVPAIPLEHLIAVNLDHYRVDADYKHGLHYTALPTAYVAGIEMKDRLAVGSRTAWILDSKEAKVGFLEFTGQGLLSFEKVLDRDERQMAVLGSRMLESQKRSYESAQTIELRQTAEFCVLGVLAQSVSRCLTGVLRLAGWWLDRSAELEAFGREVVAFDLTQDYTPLVMTGDAVNALVGAWERGAISRDTMLDALRRGEILLDARTNAQEAALAAAEGRGVVGGETKTK